MAQPDDFNGRYSFLTTFVQLTFGVTDRFNLGLDAQFKATRNHPGDRGANPFDVFAFGNDSTRQARLTYIGPRVKFIPFNNFRRLSIQSTIFFPVGKDFQGGDKGRPFLEFDKYLWWSQFFIDNRINDYFNIFTGLDILYRFAGSSTLDNQVETPVTLIFSAFPTKKLTIYALNQYYPTHTNGKFQNAFFLQVGVGMKYQVARSVELEVSYGEFIAGKNGGAGTTLNLGVRYIPSFK